MIGRRVLVVDDEPTVLEFIRKVLVRHEFECATAEDAGQAFDQMTREHAHLVITDIHMPGSDGAWLLGAIKEHWPEVPVIMLTGDSEAEMAVHCIRSGATDYLVKPIEIPSLLSAVRSALGLDDTHRQDAQPEES